MIRLFLILNENENDVPGCHGGQRAERDITGDERAGQARGANDLAAEQEAKGECGDEQNQDHELIEIFSTAQYHEISLFTAPVTCTITFPPLKTNVAFQAAWSS